MSDEIRLPGNLKTDARIDSWLAINAGGTVTLRTGKVEFGQGVVTAIAQIGAEELDVAPGRVLVVTADTGATVDEKLTAGSGSIGGIRLPRSATPPPRRARFCMGLAAEKLGVPADGLSVEDGTVTSAATNRQVTYWELMGGKGFEADVPADTKPKAPEQYRIVGTALARIDLPAKVTGKPAFIQDMDVDRPAARPRGAPALLRRDAQIRRPRRRAQGRGRGRGGARRQLPRRRRRERGRRRARPRGAGGRLHLGRDRAVPRRGQSVRLDDQPGERRHADRGRAAGGQADPRDHDTHRRRPHGRGDLRAPVPVSCLDRPVRRHGALGRRRAHGLGPQPGHLSAARGARLRVRYAEGQDPLHPRRERRGLWPQRRRRRGHGRGHAGARGAGPDRARAVDARRRVRLGALRLGHGDERAGEHRRDRRRFPTGTSTCGPTPMPGGRAPRRRLRASSPAGTAPTRPRRRHPWTTTARTAADTAARGPTTLFRRRASSSTSSSHTRSGSPRCARSAPSATSSPPNR